MSRPALALAALLLASCATQNTITTVRPRDNPIVVPATTEPPGQERARLCREARNFKVGQWAVYRERSRVDGETESRLAVVDSEMRGDTTLLWVETSYITPQGDSGAGGAMAVLEPRRYGEKDTLLVRMREAIVKSGSLPAIRVERSLFAPIVKQLHASRVASEGCMRALAVGWETVAVPAGSFRTLHMRGSQSDRWLADSVPFGVVKETSPLAESVLLDYGTGAVARIQEAPTPLLKWMAQLDPAGIPANQAALPDSAHVAGVVSALCRTLDDRGLLRGDSLPPAIALIRWLAGLLPGLEQPPELVQNPNIQVAYPGHLRRAGIGGRVTVQVVVDTTGTIAPGTLSVVRAADPDLVPPVKEYLGRSRFKPSRVCGRAVKAGIELPFDFTANN